VALPLKGRLARETVVGVLGERYYLSSEITKDNLGVTTRWQILYSYLPCMLLDCVNIYRKL